MPGPYLVHSVWVMRPGRKGTAADRACWHHSLLERHVLRSSEGVWAVYSILLNSKTQPEKLVYETNGPDG